MHWGLGNFGILGLNNDLAVMTDFQYRRRIIYLVRYRSNDVMNKLNYFPDVTTLVVLFF